MRVFCLVVFLAVLVLRVAADTRADAADPPYLGAWKVTAAVVAPWASAQHKPDAAERARMMGKNIIFRSGAIAGPPPFACPAPHYRLTEASADLLFQGAFDDMRRRDGSANPDKIAAELGFTGKTARTLETGCDFEFHFVDASTARVGLNDYVYTVTKQ